MTQRFACLLLAISLFAMPAVAQDSAQESTASPAVTQGNKPPAPVRIQSGVMAGRILEHKVPKYPAEAKAKGISGTVLLHAVIAKDGTIQGLNVVSGPEELRDAATDAVQAWRYEPYLLNGEPTEVETTIAVNFNLNTPPKRARISSSVMQGLLITRVAPVYPLEAKAKHIQGTVILHAIIGKDGSLQSLDAISGPAELQQAAKDAASQWRYHAYLLNGEPVEVETTIIINFNLAS